MTDLNNLSERDLIVMLHGKVDVLMASKDDHETRLRLLEDKANKAVGFWEGANWLKGLIATLPVGVAGWFFGQQ